MAHFVCATCKGVAETTGYCQTPDCAHYGEELKECSCEDEAHAEVTGEPTAEGEEVSEM